VTHRRRTSLAVLLLAALLAGCLPWGNRPPGFDRVLGRPGHEPGTFHRPRGICYLPAENELCVVDWDGRLQRLTPRGKFIRHWMMPEVAKGKPESLCLTPEQTLLVTDTHYSRIVEFTLEGKVLHMFGSYGRGPGQFIYPVGICMDRQGQIYVSEYGENDRIQKFDRQGRFLQEWGRFGSAPGEFQRPSGLALDADENLYVADAVNHRIQVFTTSGQLLRILGSQGREPGQFIYPYDVSIGEGHLYVVEYGGQRVQKLTLTGEPVARFGQAGRGNGCFAAPWRLTWTPRGVFVSDTDNGRVVKVPL
jgi:DNA-binding beta-propeller fold protein YncE